ncbi:MAG: hypothetical protein JWR44_1758 [Hymenobacter sp.]|jgi:hypothetical protein|nr:hypothetical protein [Hymenobacter sp.]
MSGLFLVVLLGFMLIGITLVVCWVYKVVRPLRYRAAIRTWLVLFCAELFLLMCIPEGVHVAGVPYMHRHGGFIYILEVITSLDRHIPAILRGREPDELSLLLFLLLPLVPALLVFFYIRHQLQAATKGLPANLPSTQDADA